ncbi:MAG TPA: nuclear transport factor 2 family protein [Draconibacterium sp.]|nr:nuclear transport factor 2 family protein [Draconibacterium sp.]
MKTTQVFLTVILASFFILSGCSKEDDNEQEAAINSEETFLTKSASASSNSAAISNDYPQAQQEVLETFGAIAESIVNGAGKGYDSEYMDQLISFHAYGDKFVEFNAGETFDSAGNEHNERQLFGEDLEEDGVLQFAAKEGTLKVAVYYGNVANLTFVSDFILVHKQYGEITINNLITLLFVKTNGQWKLVHEHHSPLSE